ncbi:hypothetical protein IVA95_30415 [Bradyrhizobium sp. 157]|uniref:hypothetical protein n=1 Tax=Bradyrhizobium sp. 157 TaxID=2782631 RepID=UPI001FF94E2F|nr:hypothetical protein [Bradyrhizobium sp. 157]MCK1641743.1 hypothetical protein [Bradyrhizobium sp. 157]
MIAQKREAGRNYIGLLHDETEEQRVADISAAANYPILEQILDLIAAMFSRRSEARWLPHPPRR